MARRFYWAIVIFFLATLASNYIDGVLVIGPERCPEVRLGLGLFFAVLALFPTNTWGQFLVTGTLASLFYERVVGFQEYQQAIVESLAAFSSAATIVMILRRTGGPRWNFTRSANIGVFLVSAYVVPMIFGVLFLSAPRLDMANPGSHGIWQLWCLSEATGLVITAPMLLLWMTRIPLAGKPSVARLLEGIAMTLCMAMAADFVFGNLVHHLLPIPYRFSFVLFAPLLWAAMRFGLRLAATISFCVSIFAAWSLTHSLGPFRATEVLTLDRVVLSQALILCFQLCTLLPAGVIAERENVSNLLRQTSAIQQAVIKGANMSFIVLDVNGIIRSVDETTERWLGWPAPELIGRMGLVQLHDSAHMSAVADHWSRQLGRRIRPGLELYQAMASGHRAREHEMLLRKRDGSTMWVAQSITFLREDEQITGYLAISRDISWRKQTEKALRESESAVRSFFDAAPMMMGIIELHQDEPVLISANRATSEFLGSFELSMLPLSDAGMPEEMCRVIKRGCQESQIRATPVREELAMEGEQAERRFVVTVSHIAARETELPRFCFIVEDVTKQHHTREELDRFAAMLEATTDIIAYTNKAGNPLYLNRAGRELFGIEAEQDVTTMSLGDFYPPWAYEIVRREGIPVAMLEGSWQGETAVWRPDGVEIPVSQLILAHRSSGGVEFLSMLMRDISERKATEETIRTSLREKEALLKEIHHRVKNNMQVVSSLIGLQSGYVQDPQARAVFAECRERIKTMALIHEKLYLSGNLGSIDFGDFVRSVVPMIFSAHSVRGSTIRIQIDADRVPVGIDVAIPLGLLVNELVSNSLKHGFADQKAGVVSVSLKTLPDGRVRLVERDDGRGLPEGFDPSKSSSLGLKLVTILTRQIGAELEISGQNGASFAITFRPREPEITGV